MSQHNQRSENVVWHDGAVSRADREELNGHKGAVLWLTGLSGSGKSTLANAVAARLHALGCRTYVCDGDNVRHGLCGDLGFSAEDRRENIRRVGELVRLFLDAGMVTLTAFISPYKEDRERARALVPQGDFIEVYCDTPLTTCEERDVKGLYTRARSGEIKEFTGISSPYEVPENPEIIVPTGSESLEACVGMVIQFLAEKEVIKLGAG